MSAQNNNTQITNMKKAIGTLVDLGPDFLLNKVSAVEIANTMVKSVNDFAEKETKDGSITPVNQEANELLVVLQEIMGCGSGFLANRCDAACVARTITALVDEFGE